MKAAAIVLLRRLWWATLPYDGWFAYSDADDGPKPPLRAYPLAWVHRRVAWLLRHQDVFGPLFNRWLMRPLVGATRPRTWQ